MAALESYRSGLTEAKVLHLIDIENLLGTNPREAPIEAFERVAERYKEVSGFKVGDHIHVGCNQANSFVAKAVFPESVLRVRHGKDGGEMAILGDLDPSFIARTYSRVIIGSGDGAFADLASSLTEKGLEVRVVAATKLAVSHKLWKVVPPWRIYLLDTGSQVSSLPRLLDQFDTSPQIEQ